MNIRYFLLLLFFASFNPLNAQTITPTITINETIDQNWVNNHAGPWTISEGVTVTFAENLTITSTTQYFVITNRNVTIDGARHTVTFNGVSSFSGLVNASNANAASAIIKNIGVANIGSSLANENGYVSANYNKATITNCFNTGAINAYKFGGIAGSNNAGTISNCYNAGVISGNNAGGIVGSHNSASISNCYNTGTISGNESGGIAGYDNYGLISNCFSTGAISGGGSGGIAGSYNNASISNCYSTGVVSGGDSGGIVGKAKNPNASLTNTFSETSGNWNNTNADYYLIGTGVDSIWNTSISPYTLIAPPIGILTIYAPSASLTSCLGVASASPVSFGIQGSALTASVTISAPANFEVAKTINGTYASSLELDGSSGTVTSTLFARLTASAPSGTTSGTITASSSGATNFTTTISGTVNPSFVLSQSSINLCNNASFLMSASTSFPVSNGWRSSDPSITVNSSGFVTAGGTNGSFLISYTDACAQTVSATITVGSTSSITITDNTALPNYKFISNTPQGPVDLTNNGTNNYVGYKGFTYSSQTRPTNTGYYRASKQVGNEAGCPIPFYIIKCDACN